MPPFLDVFQEPIMAPWSTAPGQIANSVSHQTVILSNAFPESLAMNTLYSEEAFVYLNYIICL